MYITDTRASIHRWVVVPALRWVYKDPEEAHEVGNYSLKALWRLGLYPRERGDPDAKGDLEVEVFGTTLRNPIGTSAGIDKHADIPDPLMALGPAIIEIGGTTPQPQPGNEKPRVFRISSQNAMINRYGLNSEGADHVAARLRQRVREYAQAKGLGFDKEAEKTILDGGAGVPPGSLTPGKLLAVNIAKNKSTPETDIKAVAADYVYCVDRLAPYADILVVNVSSPNTPGLRTLQQGESLKKILTAVVGAAQATDRKTKPAVMVKVSPDEDSDEQVSGICQAVWESGVDGVIVGNTTNHRPPTLPHLHKLTPTEEQHLLEQGGFSGPHLFERTVALTKKYKKMLGDVPPAKETPRRSAGSVAAEASKIKGELAANKAKDAPVANISKDGVEVTDKVSGSVDSLIVPARNIAEKPDSEKQPLFQLATDKFYGQSVAEQNKVRTDPTDKSTSHTNEPLKNAKPGSSANPTKSTESTAATKSTQRTNPVDSPKVIFATGGITNGKQALEVLNAGASVAMVYTALVYGGAGTISRIKDEMREELKAKKSKKRGRTTKVTS